MDFRTTHLGIDRLGRVWILDTDGDRVINLGHIDWDADWPKSQGFEPEWFAPELNELVDRWNDAGRFAVGSREAERTAYLESIGAL